MADTTPDLARRCPSIRTFTGWTVFIMVLLRIAIGWHFAYEGAWKLHEADWRATGYLVQSTGPLRPVFRAMVWDVDALKRLTPEWVKERIDERYAEIQKHYVLTADQRKAADAFVQARKAEVDEIFADPDFQNELKDYQKFLAHIEDQEKYLGGKGPDFNVERVRYDYIKKAQAQGGLLARAQAPVKAIDTFIVTGDKDKGVVPLLEAKQYADAQGKGLGPLPHEKSQTFLIDWANMLALTAVGVCLMLGLFTRLAALGGIGLLMLYYFAMPPFPGYPESPMTEGHYLMVNKNLVEALALLMIATTRIGRWAGLDAYVGAIRGRIAKAESVEGN